MNTSETAEVMFPNTKEGRKAAEEHSLGIGAGGFWEDFVDLSEDEVKPDKDQSEQIADSETMALLAVAKSALEHPSEFSPSDLSRIGTALAKRGIPVSGLPVDLSELAEPLPMQPGEASWASWKCGGGPHNSEFEPSPVRSEYQPERTGKTALETTVMVVDISDAMPPKRIEMEVSIPNSYWANMIP